jgi:hypothetical protein
MGRLKYPFVRNEETNIFSPWVKFDVSATTSSLFTTGERNALYVSQRNIFLAFSLAALVQLTSTIEGRSCCLS